MMKVNEKINNSDNSLFLAFRNMGVPWEISPTILDDLYLVHSGNKELFSPFENMAVSYIGTILWAKHIKNWEHLYKLVSAEYNPINNYDMTENLTEKNNGSNSNENKSTVTDVSRETLTNGMTDNRTETTSGTNTTNTNDTTKINTSGNNDNSVYAFDSASASPNETSSASATETHSGGVNTTETLGTSITHTGGTTENGSRDNNLTHNGTNESNGTTSNELTRTLTRVGNIGVQTTSDMIGKEISLWVWNFFETVFNDIDNDLTISVY